MRKGNPLREILNAALGILKEYKNTSFDLAKIEATIYYVQLVKSVRHICLSLCGVLIALCLVITGMIMIHVFLISLAGENAVGRSIILFLLAAVDLGIGLGVFYQLFSEERWLKQSGTEALVENVTDSK